MLSSGCVLGRNVLIAGRGSIGLSRHLGTAAARASSRIPGGSGPKLRFILPGAFLHGSHGLNSATGSAGFHTVSAVLAGNNSASKTASESVAKTESDNAQKLASTDTKTTTTTTPSEGNKSSKSSTTSSYLSEQQEPEEKKFHNTILRQLFKYLWPKDNLSAKVRVVIALSLLVGSKVLNVQVPFFFKDIIDNMNVDWTTQVGEVSTVVGAMVLGYGLARFGSVLFGELRNAIFATVAQKAIRQVATNTFEHLLKLDLGFHLSRQTGAMTRAIERGTKGISYVLTSMVFHIIPLTLEISIVSGILTWNYGFQFAAMAVGTMAAYSIFTIKTTSWRSQFRRDANRADNVAANVALDSLINYESVKYFNNEKFQVAKYDVALKDYEKSSIKIATSLAYLNSGQNFIFSSALTAIMYMACSGVADGSLSVGDLVLVNQLVFQLSVPLNFLGSVYRDLKQSLWDMEALFKLQDVNVTIKEPADARPYQYKGGEIRFENVTFGYHADRPILKNATFVIPSGQRVALVGSSGSGKSTILRLLFRFYDVQEGRILVDGQDIRNMTLESIRQSIAVVPQDTPLFNDTIRNNIHYGRLSATNEEVEEVAERAELGKLISQLPDGYETQVGERGLMISGGEKQRLAISRVLLKKSPIIFFDEATSALDTETEKALLQNINYNLKELRATSVFIAHRLKTVADTDKIIVLRNGTVAEEGKHQDLLQNPNSLYYNMWKAQEHHDHTEVEEGEKQTIESA
ncbi:ATP-binding cassette Fe/S cluster precursor transporter ATM1 [Sugiyamaella lignohabitans]|uniref:Iron-sulfur clusters transporter ATM1, mitochondrial n=1 Tax=Sugiyamaella lignohabitans TaxID=796027 RepID=A0A167CC69_9ASCO|nr:ATP-binding cassette Fe/S cluster precursor transporter ATM1 [Sugiyamaella lignohabitans]ANB11493.1 ATP-binding cassette Fe/S cluster precursor transporter ATM1 [Sugiyamaella lignohabitans]